MKLVRNGQLIDFLSSLDLNCMGTECTYSQYKIAFCSVIYILCIRILNFFLLHWCDFGVNYLKKSELSELAFY